MKISSSGKKAFSRKHSSWSPFKVLLLASSLPLHFKGHLTTFNSNFTEKNDFDKSVIPGIFHNYEDKDPVRHLATALPLFEYISLFVYSLSFY